MSGSTGAVAPTTKVAVVRGAVVTVARSREHGFSKQTRAKVRLVEGLGVEGDVHAGATVRHRSRVRRDAAAANLRQVHLIGC